MKISPIEKIPLRALVPSSFTIMPDLPKNIREKRRNGLTVSNHKNTNEQRTDKLSQYNNRRVKQNLSTHRTKLKILTITVNILLCDKDG